MVNDRNSSAAARPARGGPTELVAPASPDVETGPPTGPVHLSDLPTVHKRAAYAAANDGRGARWALDTWDTMVDYAPALQRAAVLEMIATSPHPVVGAQGQVVPDSRATSSAREALGRKLASNTVVSLLARIMTYGASLPLSIITSRLLGPHDKGIYTLFLVVAVLFSYCTLGVSSAGIYLVGKKLYPLREVVSTLVTLGLVLSVVTISLFVVIGIVFPAPVLSEVPPSLRIVLLGVGPLMLLGVYLSDCQLAAQDIVGYNIGNIVQVVTQALGLACFFLLYHRALSAAAWSFGLSAVFSCVTMLALLLRHTRISLRLNLQLLRKMFSFGIRSYLAAILNLGNVRLDTILLSLFVGVTSVGYYSVATTMSEVTWQLPVVMSTVLFPTTAALSSSSGARVTARVCRRLLLILIICLVILFVGAPTFLEALFGSAFLPALIPLWLLLPGAVGLALYKTLYSYLLGNGRPGVGIVSAGSALVVTVTLDLLLIPIYGINGAALTSSIAYCLNGLIVLLAFAYYSHINPLEALVPTPRDVRELSLQVAGAARRLRRLVGGVNGKEGPTAEALLPPGALLWIGGGLIAGLWLDTVLGIVPPTLFLLLTVGGMTLLALTNRHWLVAAMLSAGLTLSDYRFAADAPTLRVLLGILVIFATVVALAQGSYRLGRDARVLLVPLVLFLGVGTLSNLVNGGDTRQFLSHSFAGIIIMLFLAGAVRSARDLAIVGVSALFVAVLSALTALLQVFLGVSVTVGGPQDLLAYPGRGFGLTQTPISLGNDLAIILGPLAALLLFRPPTRRLAILGWSAVALLAVGTYTTGSRSGLIALGASVAVLALGLPRRQRWAVLLVLLVLGATVTLRVATPGGGAVAVTNRTEGDTEISASQRLVLWEAGALIVRDHPLVGIGYARFVLISAQYRDQVAPTFASEPEAVKSLGTLSPHNDFLMVLLSFGPLGLLTYLWLNGLAAWSAWRTWRGATHPWLRAAALGCLAGLVAYTVHSFVHNAYDNSLLLWALFGVILALDRLRSLEPQPRPQA